MINPWIDQPKPSNLKTKAKIKSQRVKISLSLRNKILIIINLFKLHIPSKNSAKNTSPLVLKSAVKSRIKLNN